MVRSGSLRRRAVIAAAGVVALLAAFLAIPTAAQAQKVGNPGSFALNVEGGQLRIKAKVFDLTPDPLPECSNGVDDEADADAPPDGLVDFPADPQCSSATDNSELAGGLQPKQSVSISGTIDSAGGVTVPTSGVVFPTSYIYSADAGIIAVRILPTADATGSLNPITGSASIRVRVRIKLENDTLGGSCFIGSTTSPVDLNTLVTGVTAPPAPNTSISGVPYDPSTGMATLVNNTFSVPGASGCALFGLANGAINTALGLPSAAGNNDAILQGAITPVLTKGVNAAFTTSPSTGPSPLTVNLDASSTTSSKAISNYAWDLDNNGTFEATGTSPTRSVTLSPAGTYTIRMRATDADGDADITSRAVVVTAPSDSTPPSVSCDAAPTGWSGANVGVRCTASDGQSGLANPADASFELQTNVTQGQETATAVTDSREICDTLGNCTTAGPVTGVKVDRKAPVITIARPALGDSYEAGTLVNAAYTCVDGGAGTTACAGTVPNGSPLPTSVIGNRTFSVGAADAVGNAASASSAYEVYPAPDTTPPQISCSTPPTGWQADNVTVTCTASDDNAGLQNPSDASFTLVTNVAAGTETATAATGSRNVCDTVGNCATAGPFTGLKVDRKKPTVTLNSPADNSSFFIGEPFSVDYDCADGGSGIAQCTGDAADGTSIVGLVLGPFTFTATARDAAGNEAAVTNDYGIIDTPDDTAPVVSCSTPPTEWRADNVTVTCTATDDKSGLTDPAAASFPLSTTVPDDTETADATTSSREVCDVAGNCVTAGPFTGLKVDRKAPDSTIAAPLNGAQYVLNTPVVVAYDCSDAGSGLATCGATAANGDFADTLSLGTKTFTVLSTDAVGNEAAEESEYEVIEAPDVTPPGVTCDAPPAGWQDANVTITCTASDADSGLADPSDAAFTLSTAVPAGTETSDAATGLRTVCDVAGNCVTEGPFTGILVDRKAPTVTLTSPPAGSTWTVGSSIPVAYACSDAGSGIDGCAGDAPDGSALAAVIVGPADFSVTATDAAGNSTTKTNTYTVTVAPDTSAPTVTCDAAPTGWSAQNVSVNCTAADGQSGLVNPADAAFTLTTNVAAGVETANASTNVRQVCDVDGNCATAGPISGVKVDRKAPSVSITSPADGATYTVGASVTAAYSCGDGGSGSATCVGNVPAGSPVDTSTPGTRTFTVSAADAAGNVGTATTTSTVSSSAPQPNTKPVSNVNGGVVVNGVAVEVNVNKVSFLGLFDFFLGGVNVRGGGVNAGGFVLTGGDGVTRWGLNGAQGSATYFDFSSFPWRSGSVNWKVDDLSSIGQGPDVVEVTVGGGANLTVSGPASSGDITVFPR